MPRILLWRQLALGLALFGTYIVVNTAGGAGRRVAADRNGRDLYDLERYLHLDIEPALNSWLADRGVLATLANYEYAYTYIVSALILFAWVYARHPELFRRVRDSFIVLNLLAMTCFVLYPVTPPRMLAESGFIDTVAQRGTVGSWGSGIVDQANQLAAMPSLHVGWALWVSAVLARMTARRSVQVLSAAHVVLTVLVVMATANHYLLDAVGAVVAVWLSVRAADAWHDRQQRLGTVVPSCDAFFLHVENDAAAQHVGGLVFFASPGELPTLHQVREVVTAELWRLPRFTQRLSDGGRWRRYRWVDAPPLDWDWHVRERSVADRDDVRGVVAELAETPLPRDRPLWRIVLIRQAASGHTAFLLLMHHSVADGLGTVIQALYLMRPHSSLTEKQRSRPRPVRRAAATVVGLAQLATDGTPAGSLTDGSPRRAYSTVALDLDKVRRVASGNGAHVTDLVLALLGHAVATTHPELAEPLNGSIRVSVPLLAHNPLGTAEGNATAAVMVDVPVDARGFSALLADIGQRTRPLRTPTRALASRFVMARALRLFPEPLVGRFVRTVYGRRFFQAIASNMPGPTEQLSIAGVPLADTYPILPLAPGAPIALGALSWAGRLGIGIASDPELVDADALASRMREALAHLSVERPHEREEQSRT